MNTAISIHSSFIKSAVYDETKKRLRIEIGNTWYYYYGVTKWTISRFKSASSKGRFFCSRIKGQYRMMKRIINQKPIQK